MPLPLLGAVAAVGKVAIVGTAKAATVGAKLVAGAAKVGTKATVSTGKFFGKTTFNIANSLSNNAQNLNKFLEKQNKNQDKLRSKRKEEKKKSQSIEKKIEKEKKLEENKSSSDQKKTEKNLAKSPLGALDKIFAFGGLLLGGILVNAVKGLIDKGKQFIKDNQELFDTIGGFLTGVKDAAVGLFNAFTGPESEQNWFDNIAKFSDDGKIIGGALLEVDKAYDKLEEMLKSVMPALKGAESSSPPTPSREELVKQTERGSGMASFREDAAENAALQRSVMGESSGPSKKVSGSLTGTKEEKWAAVMAMAKNAGAKYPELVAAQFALESAWGTALAAKNNFFGIKATGKEDATVSTTEEVYGGKRVTIDARFKNFATPQDAINHLVNQWYKDYRGYSGVNNAPNAAAAALKLKSEGYATDPVYAQSLQRLMREYSNIQPKQSQPQITPVPDKGDQARIINQPDPTDEEVATLFIQRVNTIQYVPVTV